MSFSGDIKEEIFKNSENNKYIECVRFGEIITEAKTLQEIKELYKYFDIAKQTKNELRNILAGAFLNSGCIVSKNYHFELSFKAKVFAEYVFNILSLFEFSPKITKRNNNYIIYFKESEQISLFLSVIGASKCMMEFESIRVEKEVKNNVNRNVNCETANIYKTIKSSQRQLEAIAKIKKKSIKLNQKLEDVANIREKYPDESIEYLANKLGISKSGMKHRLDKILDIALEKQADF